MKKDVFVLIEIGLLLFSFSVSLTLGCTSHEYQCSPDQCIPSTQRCDGSTNCADGNDEINCNNSRCSSKEFRCDNGMCKLYVYRCDGDNDCTDGSDERCDPFLDHFLIVANNGKDCKGLCQIDLHTNVMLPLGLSDFTIGSLAFDSRRGDIYWTNSDSNSIQRHSLISGNKTMDTIFSSEAVGTLEGLALDPDGDQLFYCQSDIEGQGHGLIGVVSLNGKNHRIVVSEPKGRPHSIVLDTANRLMYWIDLGPQPAIVRAQMDDGGERTVLVNSNLRNPKALAIDTQAQVLYWGDAGLHRIERFNLTEHRDRRAILDETARNASYYAFALGPDFLYLTDRKQGSIRKLHLETLRVQEQLPTDVFTRLSGVLYYNSYGTTPLVALARTTTGLDPFASTNHTEVTTSDPRRKVQHGFRDSSVTTVITVVIGVVIMTIVITVGVVVVKARRTSKTLSFEKRLVSPPADRENNSYFYSPFDAVVADPSSFVGANGEAPSGSNTTTSFSSPFSPNPFFRMAATRTSSFKPIITDDALQTNNVYSTVVGDYENVDTYEIIEDPLV